MFDTKQAPNAQHLSAIVHALPSAIVIVNEAGSIVLVNAEAQRLFGYTREELLGEPIEALIPNQFRGRHPALRGGFSHLPAARRMGVGRDLHGLHKSGREFPVEIGLNPIKTEAGLFVVSAIVDITDRKRQEARFRATIQSLPTVMVMVDQTGTILLVNSELETLFGYSASELVNAKIEKLIPPKYLSSHPGLRTQYLAAPSARRMGAGRDLFGLRKDGQEFPIEIGLNPVLTDEGTFILAAIIDLTERTRQNETLRRANEALERSNIELQRFAYIASHDLQTPLRTMASFVQLLEGNVSSQLDPQSRDWMQRIVKAADRMQILVRELLDYSRIETQPIQFQSIPFREVIDDALAALQLAIEESGAKVSCGGMPVVRGDRSQLLQLMTNLLGNAIKYRAAAPLVIAISAAVRDDWVVVDVSDNGIGIDPKHHESIFEIFKRLHSSHEYPGTGIGLAISRRVVNTHGGSLRVDSMPGKGSTFQFTLPVAENPS